MVAFSLAGSPFVSLPVTPRSSREDIEAAFEARRAARPAAEPAFADAKARLLSPDGRLAAELAWIIDVGPLTAGVLLEAMGRGDPAVLLSALTELPPVSKANVSADACIRLRSTAFIVPLEAAHGSVDLAALTALINEIHAAAGEPGREVGDVGAAFAALTELHATAALEAMAAQGASQDVLSDLLRTPRPSRLVEALLAQYYQGASQPFVALEAEIDQALTRLTDGRDAEASEILDLLPKWRTLNQPVLRHAKGLGVDDPRSLRVYGKIRNACFYLANDKRQSSAVAEILVALHGAFEDLPSSNADIEGDQTFLKKLAAAGEPATETTSAPTASYQASPVPAAEKPVRDYLSRFQRPSIRLTAPGSRDAIVWVLVGLIVLATLGVIVFQYRAALFGHPGGETLSRSFSAPTPKEPTVNHPPRVESRQVSDKSLLAVIPAGGVTETRPPTGRGLLLDKSQLRYCMFNRERLNNVDPTIRTLTFMSKLDSVLADFNARCGQVKYMSDDFKGVSAELDAARPELRREAQDLATQWTQ